MKRITFWLATALAVGGLTVVAPGVAVSHADPGRCAHGANCTGAPKSHTDAAPAPVRYESGEDPLVPEGGNPIVILPPGYSLAF